MKIGSNCTAATFFSVMGGGAVDKDRIRTGVDRGCQSLGDAAEQVVANLDLRRKLDGQFEPSASTK